MILLAAGIKMRALQMLCDRGIFCAPTKNAFTSFFPEPIITALVAPHLEDCVKNNNMIIFPVVFLPLTRKKYNPKTSSSVV